MNGAFMIRNNNYNLVPEKTKNASFFDIRTKLENGRVKSVINNKVNK